MTVHGSDELFSLSGLNALVSTAAENSPDHILIQDDDGVSTAAQVARRVRGLASQLVVGGLIRGERVLIVGGAEAASIVAVVAALRAGLEPVLAAPGIHPIDLATCAQVSGAAALIGPSRYGDLDLGETYLSTAAIAESIRGILTHGPDRTDGAADISFPALDAMPDVVRPDEPLVVEMPTIATFAGARTAPRLVSHRQASLFADALSLVEQARINPSKPVISLLAPASLGGLVGGPFAAWVGASRLVLHGPFDGRRFLAHCDADPQAHVLAPAAIGRTLERCAGDLSSMILVSRFADAESFVLPEAVAGERPVVDLYAFGEASVLAQRRQNGEPDWPKRVADLSATDGLGARLNRARAEQRIHSADHPW